jgi:hypothetical protein
MPIEYTDGQFIYRGPAAVLSALANGPEQLGALLTIFSWLGDETILGHTCDGTANECAVDQLIAAFKPFHDYLRDDIPAIAYLLFLSETYQGAMYPIGPPVTELPNIGDILSHVNKILGIPDDDPES